MSRDDERRVLKPGTTLYDEERKYLEGLLKERFNFFLVFASLLFVAVFGGDDAISTPGKVLALAGGTLVSLLIFLSVWRTHLLAKKALEQLNYTNHPWDDIRRIHFPPYLDYHANAYLVAGTGLISVLFLLLTILAVTGWGAPTT